MTLFAENPRLHDAQVALEPLGADHLAGLETALRDGEQWRNWTTFIPAPKQLSADVNRRIAQQRAGECAPWAIRRLDTDALCGMTSFLHLAPEHLRLEIGATWLAASAQRTGVNPAVKLLLLTRAFETLACNVVELRTHWHNHRSRAAIERLGAKQDGVLRNHMVMPDGSLRDTVVFSITASEWPAVRTGLQHRLGR